jgi:CRISPR/Cas system-associated exonuclease Cas4 (RecB family)
VEEMKEYLVDGDIGSNEPLPRENWPQTSRFGFCRNCSFYELCAPELDA